MHTLKASKQGTFHPVHSEKLSLSERQAIRPEPQFSQVVGQPRAIPLRRVLRAESVSMEHILMLFTGVKALEKVNIVIIVDVIKRDAGAAWLSWEKSVLSTS